MTVKHIFKPVRLLAASVAASALAGGAASALTVTGTSAAVPTLNSFKTEMAAAFGGVVNLGFMTGVTLTTAGGAPATLTFTEVAAESGYRNGFADGTSSMTEVSNFGFGSDFLTSAGETFASTAAGVLTGLTFTSNLGIAAELGSIGFGIFYDTSVANGLHSVLFLAFDDQGGRGDRDYDDYIVRLVIEYADDNAPAVPLPAGMWLSGAAFGGLAMARRRTSGRG